MNSKEKFRILTKKNTRGITLIALVITVIVLLILAAVTINALSGDNGILKKATEAKQKTRRADALEKIRLAVMTATTNGVGEANLDDLKAELEKAGATIKTTAELPWGVTLEGDMFRINEDLSIDEISGIGISKKELKLLNGESETLTAIVTEGVTGTIKWESSNTSVATVENGKVTAVGTSGTATITVKVEGTDYSDTCAVIVTKPTVSVTAAEIAANKEKYYGKVAENYTQGGLTYRIFYVDTENKFGDGANTVYLKADYKDEKSLITDISGLTTGDIQKYKSMNPKWAAQRGSVQSEWKDNEKGAAWLCAPSQWESYLDDTKATYAIGAPSAEMYVASYNDVPHTQVENYTLGAVYRATNVPGYIYTLNGAQSTISNSDYNTGTDSLDYKGYNSMYVGRNGSKGSYYWWLASPSAGDSISVCYAYGYDAFLGCNYYTYSHGVAPIVSLKSGILIQVEK